MAQEGRDEKGKTPTWKDWFELSKKIKIAQLEFKLQLIKNGKEEG